MIQGLRASKAMTARILIIDDDPQIRRVIMRILRDSYEVFEASDGESGLMFFMDHKIDLVITDVIMPNKDGLELITELGELDPPPKILAISGGGIAFGLEQSLFAAKAFGALSVLAKPFAPDELREGVEDLLSSG